MYWITDAGIWHNGTLRHRFCDPASPAKPRMAEVECPGCDRLLDVVDTAEDQRVRCRECDVLYGVSYDAEPSPSGASWRQTYTLTPIPEREWRTGRPPREY